MAFAVGLITSRVVIAEIAGSKVTRKLSRGTPQGGVISPLLWLLVVDELFIKLEKEAANIIRYADDLAILVRVKFPDILSELISNFLSKNGLLVKV